MRGHGRRAGVEAALEDGVHHPLHDGDDVVLGDEGHLEVELGELELAVGALVLVAEAAGDLVVALEAAHHEQLLEELRRLRQRVPRPRLQARGHEEVARALGRRAREDRRLELEEVELVERRAHRLRDRVAQHQRVAHALAAQVQPAVPQAQRLVDRALLVDREGRRLAVGQHVHAPTCSSISPVGSAGLTCPASRRTTRPATLTTCSERSRSAAAKASPLVSGWKTSCSSPERSRRSMKIRPPWSRRRCTQPATRTSARRRRRAGRRPRRRGSRWPRGGSFTGPAPIPCRAGRGRRPPSARRPAPARRSGCP